MKLSYRLATIAYCPDLTDPAGTSMPIAVLAVGEGDGVWFAAAAAVDAKRLGLDPLAAAMLADVPHLMRRHLDGAMKRLDATATPHAVLREFHESLRTSIHVSEISDAFELQAADPRRLPTDLLQLAVSALESAFRARTTLALTRSTPPTWVPRVPPEELMHPAPEQASWQPTPPAAMAVS